MALPLAGGGQPDGQTAKHRSGWISQLRNRVAAWLRVLARRRRGLRVRVHVRVRVGMRVPACVLGGGEAVLVGAGSGGTVALNGSNCTWAG